MGMARLGFVATFLSDPLISGFTTGSAVLVVISQLKHILGQTVPKIVDPLAAPKVNTFDTVTSESNPGRPVSSLGWVPDFPLVGPGSVPGRTNT